MNEINKQKVGVLRQRVPIGISHGLNLLEKTNGDIDAAEILFKDEILQIVISKTGVAQDVALRHLISNSYDITVALKCIDEERFTLSELIYKRFKNKENALTEVLLAVEKQYNIKEWGDGSVDLKPHLDLPQEILCLVAIMSWISHEEFEGFDVALSFELALVTDLIENVLKLASLANSMRRAKYIYELIYKAKDVRIGIENYIKTREDEIYQKCEADYSDQKDLLIESLYNFVKVNINKFP